MCARLQAGGLLGRLGSTVVWRAPIFGVVHALASRAAQVRKGRERIDFTILFCLDLEELLRGKNVSNQTATNIA